MFMFEDALRVEAKMCGQLWYQFLLICLGVCWDCFREALLMLWDSLEHVMKRCGNALSVFCVCF